MKAIILAAGMGTRLGDYTKELPKGMLEFNKKTIIKHQIDIFRSCGIKDIIVVTGYQNTKINYDGVKYYHNSEYSSTNMVASLFCAEEEFNDDVIISYADILFEKSVVQELMNIESDFSVTVDMSWQNYWVARYGKLDFDLEALFLNENGTKKELGKDTKNPDNVEARYVGIMKFSKEALKKVISIYHENKNLYWDKEWKNTGRSFRQVYMTDFLQNLINSGNDIVAHKINNKWLEFDTVDDYEKMNKLLDNNEISKYIKLED